ncbi:MAG TPA: T9SS type A sorting domain-containing protein [Aquaticitalea sp.]|nr:T9SS type A sorting domain-containing protein [Aquaticitalea sp.]
MSVGASNVAANTTPSIEEDGCFGANVVAYYQGTQQNGSAIPADRSDINTMLGAPDRSNAAGGFFSLGVDGWVIIDFNGAAVIDGPGADIMVYETSFSGDNCGYSDDEYAMIELSDGTNWVSYGQICRDGAIDISTVALAYVTQIKIINQATTPDGYDVDGVEAVHGCQEIATECYGSTVLAYNPVDPIQANRKNPENALGAPQVDNTLNFVTLGFGGSIIIGFDGVVPNGPGDDLVIVETTFGNATFSSYPESADVYVSQNNVDYFFLGTVYTDESAAFDLDAITEVSLPWISSVKLIDTTPLNSVSDDGFDLDGIIALHGCQEPETPQLAGCYATEYLEYVQGTTKSNGVINSNRTNPLQALGEPERTDSYVFTTLGYGGSITVAFDGVVLNGPGADLQFVETSFNQPLGCSQYKEYADIYVSNYNVEGTWHYAGTVCKTENTIDISDAGDFDYITYVKIVNNDELSKTPDGYDLDGIVAFYNCYGSPAIVAQAILEDQQNTLGINGLNPSGIDATIYPNPTSTGLSEVTFTTGLSGNVRVDVIDQYGRTIANVFNKETNPGQKYNVSFNGSNLPNGLYMYVITSEEGTVSKKFVIAK